MIVFALRRGKKVLPPVTSLKAIEKILPLVYNEENCFFGLVYMCGLYGEKMKIITVTLNAALDVVVDEEMYKKTELRNASVIPAGKGINVSRALLCAGIPSTAVVIVGKGEEALFGSMNDGNLLEVITVPVEGETRRNITISNCSDGQEHHERKPGFVISEEDIEKVYNILMDIVVEGDWVVFSGSIPPGISADVYARLISICKRKGAYTALDSSGVSMISGIAASPYLIKPNREELEEIVGREITSKDELISSIRRISSMYDIPLIITTLSDKGCMAYSFEADDVFYHKAMEVKRNIVSSVGCGDSTIAGFLGGLIKHESFEDCVEDAMRFAHANLFTEVPGDLDFGVFE